MMRITGPDGRERGVDEPASPGDAFTWRWHSGYRLSGEYLPAQAENEVRFTFGDSRIAVRAVPHGIDARDMTRATGASFSTHFDPSDLGIEF